MPSERQKRLNLVLRRLLRRLRRQNLRERFGVALGLVLTILTLALLLKRKHQSTPHVSHFATTAAPLDYRRRLARAALTKIHDVMPSPSPWPVERKDQMPPEGLYGTSGERCFAIGVNDDASTLWQPNSRALCYNPNPVCLFGPRMDRLMSFKARGSAECNLLYVNTSQIMRAPSALMEGSCARFRTHRVMSMFSGSEELYGQDYDSWLNSLGAGQNLGEGHRPVEWQKDFAIVVPKYDWSSNICHYNRIWQYLMYVIRHLELFVPDRSSIREIHILFRSKPDYVNSWATGLRRITVAAVERETGYKITLSKVRHDPNVDFKCFRRAIFLGREGRVDAYPFFNDTAMWSKDYQVDDNHIPTIPHESLWFRDVAYRSFGLPDVAEFANGSFLSIPVPPLRVAHLQRSARSKRRFGKQSKAWFEATLDRLARRNGFLVRHVRFPVGSSLARQASLVRDVGFAVGVHGANFVNTIFMPPAAALFEVFPFRYVRYYYAGGANSGLRYSFHETSSGADHHCDASVYCFFMYRESELNLSPEDRRDIEERIGTAMLYILKLHAMFPSGRIPLHRRGNSYYILGVK